MDRFQKFFEGTETQAYEIFGTHRLKDGVSFCLWAPHAVKVEVLTSANDFKEPYPLKKIDERGIWVLFLPDTKLLYSYRYRIYRSEEEYVEKIDPYAFYSELRPANASVMYDLDYYVFSDEEYMRKRTFHYEDPLNIYEVHPNGFVKEETLSSFRLLKEKLIPYVKQMGYTHIELMPLFEHPLDASWGYQATGFYSLTSRYGTPYDFMDFVNECHLHGIGVILDAVYTHFCDDAFALKDYDGMPLYEKDDDSYSEWGTRYFDLGKKEVQSFLISSADFFMKKYHIDGLRLDAVSHFIFNKGNKDLGENHEGLAFLREFNTRIKKENPSCILIAEDSSDYYGVTKTVKEGGLGFDYKWDLGWMNDTLHYYAMDPEYRQYHHNLINFSMAYFYSEHFLLPLSHDETVHSKGTIIEKMWGNYEAKFAQCRNLYLYMFSHPGKKLNFMGNELALFREFDESRQLDWQILDYPAHDSFRRFFRDLCQISISYKAFYAYDYERDYFRWIDADNYSQSVYSFVRYDENNVFVIVLNNKPVSYHNYLVGVPIRGIYEELINSEKDIYSGCNMCNFSPLVALPEKMHGFPYSISIDLAPYAGIIFRCERKKRAMKNDEDRLFRENVQTRGH